MVKKSKYQLLSYLIDSELIFYKSLNRHKKLIAFAMIETTTFTKFMPILNNFLKKRLIQYYSLQMNTIESNDIHLILYFEETKKEGITRAFNIIQQKLKELNVPFKLLENSLLEKKFLDIIKKKFESPIYLSKTAKSILVSNKNDSFLLDFYSINLNNLEKKESFISNFIKIVNNFKRSGYLICNFLCDNDEEFKFLIYFVEIVIDREDKFNTEQNINNFFNYNLIKKRDIKIKEIFNFIWRRGINNNYFLLQFYPELFFNQNQQGTHILLNFNKEIEEILNKKEIQFIRFSQNLLFIEQKYLKQLYKVQRNIK